MEETGVFGGPGRKVPVWEVLHTYTLDFVTATDPSRVPRKDVEVSDSEVGLLPFLFGLLSTVHDSGMVLGPGHDSGDIQ